MYGWAPLTILGEEVNRLKIPFMDQQDSTEEITALDSLLSDSISPAQNGDGNPGAHELNPAGVFLGIWNIYATIPQFIASFIALVAFSILEPGRSLGLPQEQESNGIRKQDYPHRVSGTAACLATGAVCSFVAAMLTFRLRKL